MKIQVTAEGQTVRHIGACIDPHMSDPFTARWQVIEVAARMYSGGDEFSLPTTEPERLLDLSILMRQYCEAPSKRPFVPYFTSVDVTLCLNWGWIKLVD